MEKAKDLMDLIKFEIWHRIFIDRQSSKTL